MSRPGSKSKLVSLLFCLALAGCDGKPQPTPVTTAAPSEELTREVKELRAAVDALRERADRVAALEKSIDALRTEIAAIGKGTSVAAQPPPKEGGPSADLDRLMADVSALQARVEELAARVESAEEPGFRTK